MVVAVALTLVTAAAASAVTTDYHPVPVSRDFKTSAGGWTGTTTYSPPCLPGVTCPGVSNAFVPSDGAGGPGDGFLRSAVDGLLSVATTTQATFRSPPFAYVGAAGQVPDRVTFTLDRRVDADALLTLLGSGATYSVFLANLSKSTSVTVFADRPIANVTAWTSIPVVTVPPGSLTVDDSYQIRVVTELDLPATAIPDGAFDYDNILLRAVKADAVFTDTDGDGVTDSADNCVAVPNPNQSDADGDGIGDACDQTPGGPDTDGDGVPNSQDNCDTVPNPNQSDADGDGVGDVCDSTPGGIDTDGDGVIDNLDNCDTVRNPGQADTDGDGIGDACDPSPGGQSEGKCKGSPILSQDGTTSSDRLVGTDQRDLLRGVDGNDILLGRGGADCLLGGSGKDKLRSQDGKDVLRGNAGKDLLNGGKRNDTLKGDGGNDTLKGGKGKDKLKGGKGKDKLNGGKGKDKVVGGGKADRINPGRGKDLVNAGGGTDRIRSVDGRRDVIRCGSGIDRVVADAKDRVSPTCETVRIGSRSRR